jgi:arylsulfatase A-like enzyme
VENLASERPNVLMIVFDDLNDYIGVLKGHPQAKTPHIDRLARSGVLFANAHSSAPICAPSRGSLFTGIHPHRSGYLDFSPWFQNRTLAATPTLMRRLRDTGYTAYGVGKLLHHNRASEWDEFGPAADYGPMAYNGKQYVAHPNMPEPFRSIGPLDGTFSPLSAVPVVPQQPGAPGYTGWRYRKGEAPFRYVNETNRAMLPDEESAQWAMDKIAALDRDSAAKPFFLGVGFIRPHTPLVVPQEWFDRFPADQIILPLILPEDKADCFYEQAVGADQRGPLGYRQLVKSYPSLAAALRTYLQGYLASVAFADHQLGRVMEALERSRFATNTVVIMTSDHGYNLCQKDYFFKNSLWEESTRVPLVVRAPGCESAAGAIITHPVSLIDILPTVMDLCGVTNRGPADGHSLRPFLTNPSRPEWSGPPVAISVVDSKTASSSNGVYHLSVRSSRWRYVRYADGSEELYDHAVDPHEWENLALVPAYAGVKQEHLRQMRAVSGSRVAP